MHWLNKITNGVLCDAVLRFCECRSFQHFIHLGGTERQRYAHTVPCTGGCGGRGVVALVLKPHGDTNIYRMSQEECARLRENVPYVKVHRCNPKHLYPKLKGYGDNGERSLKV